MDEIGARRLREPKEGSAVSRAWPVILLVLLLPASVFSDSSNLEGGVFIAHHPPGLQYSSAQDWCARYFQEFAIDSCSEQNTRIDLDGNEGEGSVWFVLAAWDEEKDWCGTEFGLAEYDSTIYVFEQWGPCFPSQGMEIPMAGWPGPTTGTAVTTQDTPWSGNFVPIYWFAGYAYDEGQIPLAVNPSSGFGGTANCETPPQSWATTAFGGMGIFEDGVSACPEGLDGGGGLDGGMQPDGDGWLDGGLEGEQGEQSLPDSLYPCAAAILDVMFTQESCVRIRNGTLVDLAGDALNGVDSVLSPPEDFTWERMCSPVPESVLDSLQNAGEARSGHAVYNLNNLYHLHLPSQSNDWEVASQLEALPGIIYARPVPLPPPLPTVPDYQPDQGYLRGATEAPSGFDAEYAWTQLGGNGSGTIVCDVEYGWNYQHGDVTKLLDSQLCPNCSPPSLEYREHGTAVAGVLVATSNEWGTTGMCHGATIYTSCSTWLLPNGDPLWNPAGAICVALSANPPPDVILLEQQWAYYGQQDSRHVPIEWYGTSAPDRQSPNPVYAAIQCAVSNGTCSPKVDPSGDTSPLLA